MKKNLFVLLIVVLVVGFGAIVWFYFLGNKNLPLPQTVMNVLPFGSGDNTQTPTANKRPLPVGDSSGGQLAPTTSLFQISRDPVAGAVFLNSKNASTTIVRFVERATGHINDVNLRTLIETRVTNETLPKIYEAYFRDDGNAVIFRTLNDSGVVENLSLTLTPPKATSTDSLYTVSSVFLRGDIGSLASGAGNIIYYLLKDSGSIISSAFDGTKPKTLFTSPFTDWRLSQAGNSLILSTKASSGVPGYAYSLSTGGALTKIFGPLTGLTVVPSPSGGRIMYSYLDGGRIRSFAKNIQKNVVSEMFPRTLANKCVWSAKNAGMVFCSVPNNDPGAGDPDLWYQGVTHFTDSIWSYNTDNDTAKVLVEPAQSINMDFDAINLKLSPREDYLIFTNKIDLSLWALKLD